MPGLTDLPPIMRTPPSVVMPFVPEQYRDLVLGLWKDNSIPLASMKMENDLRHAVGITYTFTGFRYDARRRRAAVRSITAAVGNPGAGETTLAVSDAVKRVLGLLSTPIEVMGFDVATASVRQIKAYVRTNACNERFEQDVMTCDPTPPEREQEAVAAVMDIVAPQRKDAILTLLRTMQTTRGALEGIAIDFERDDCDVKMYFLPRRNGKSVDAFSQEQTMAFIDAALNHCGLQQHRERAATMVEEMLRVGLASSFQAVEQKPNGQYELKVDFNTARSGNAFPGRRIPPDAATSAIRSAYRAAGLTPDEAALTELASRMGTNGIMLDDFTTDFGAEGCSGKVYLRSAADLGGGVYALG